MSAPLKLLWLVPGCLAALVHLSTVAAAHNERDACTALLGQALPTVGRELDGTLDVLSWNIQKASNKGWLQDLAAVSDGVELAFIQEAATGVDLEQALPRHRFRAFAAGYATSELETGVMTLSTGSHSAECALTATEPWLRTPKATSITEYPLQGRAERLLAINLHAVNFDLGLGSLQSQLDTLRDVLGHHQGPVIVAGDLNTWSDPRQSLVDDFMGEFGLASVSFEPDLRSTAFGHALDHIYVRGLRPQDPRVIPVTTSDHNPLRVRLAVQ